MRRSEEILAIFMLACMIPACQSSEEEGINSFLSRKGYHATPIRQNAAGHLLVSVKVNGVAGLFILDTGAGGSVVDTKHADRLGLSLNSDSASFDGAGAGGQGLKVVPSVRNTLEIGGTIATDVALSVMSLEHVRQALMQVGAGEDFVGVIGVDILKPRKAIIDYSDMTLYLLSGT